MESTTSQPEVIPHSYIVVFKQGTPHDKCSAHCAWAAEIHSQRVYATAEESEQFTGIQYQYRLPSGWAGYAGKFDQDMVRELEEAEEVDFVEPDIKVYASKIITDTTTSWGLARICHPEKLTDETREEYIYDSSAGKGTRAYIIDTGILEQHDEFEGRATFGHNAVVGSTDTDLNGHGTHCAGTIGGKTYGVAKKTILIGVKVLGDNGSGSTSGVIAGLNWAAEDAANAGVIERSVANMSLGGGFSRAMNNAVAAVIQHGMTVCVAAGNENSDASGSSPASEPTAITVGATTIDDSASPFSNYGELVNIYAPGSYITSAWIDETGGGSTNKTNTISGTSMATPHVTGLCAYLMGLDESLKGSKAVTERINDFAIADLLTGLKGGSPNTLAHNGVRKK
jgi:oryzin